AADAGVADGNGLLSINAGANVYGANITLRGADEDINSTANVGNAGLPVVSSFAPGVGGFQPLGVAFDSSGNMYVANNGGNTIDKITFSSPGVFGTRTTFVNTSFGLSLPRYPVFDSSGNMYVANNGNNTISKITFSSPGVLGT